MNETVRQFRVMQIPCWLPLRYSQHMCSGFKCVLVAQLLLGTFVPFPRKHVAVLLTRYCVMGCLRRLWYHGANRSDRPFILLSAASCSTARGKGRVGWKHN